MLQRVKGVLVRSPAGRVLSRTIEQTTRLEISVLFLVVPFSLLLFAALPAHIQNSMTLYLSAPSVSDAYLTNFIHGGTEHLVNNLVGYVLLMGVLLPLAVFADWKRELYLTSLFFLTAVPFLVSYYSVWALRGTNVETAVGFSGVVTAFLGLLPVLLFAFLQREVSSSIRLHHSLALVALVMAGILYGWGGVSVPFLALVVLGVVGLALVYWDTRGEWDGLLSRDAHLLLVVTSVLLFAVLPFRLLVDVGAGVNVYGHLIGFVAGFLFPGVLSLVLDLREQFERLDDHLNFAL